MEQLFYNITSNNFAHSLVQYSLYNLLQLLLVLQHLKVIKHQHLDTNEDSREI